MMLFESTWQKIREKFSPEEKAGLSAAIAGETICPRGFTLDIQRIESPALRAKLLGAMEDARRR